MEEKELTKIEEAKAEIKKYIEKIYNTTSLTQEANATEEIIKLMKKLDDDNMVALANDLDVFGKCVLYYKLPIEYKMNVNLTNAARVLESERLVYWKEYKQKLKDLKWNTEEEYNKIIMMACILHTPIDDEKVDAALLKLKEEAEKEA